MKLLLRLGKELAAYDARREQIIRQSREILKESKTVIFLCHEGKLSEAKEGLNKVSKTVSLAEARFQKLLTPKRAFSLYSEGSWNASLEEYLEAWFLYHFMSKGKLTEPDTVSPPAEVIVSALSDFTGEVVRLAVMRGADKNIKELVRYRSAVADVVAGLLPMHLTGLARQKFDNAKRNLKRLEEILYEVKIRS